MVVLVKQSKIIVGKEWAKLELGMNLQLLTQSRKFPATGLLSHDDMLRLAIAYLLPMFYRTAHAVIGLPLDSIDTAKSDDDGTDNICLTSGIEIRLHSNIG
ncbi:hypothetical protein H4S04_001256 [Coemansia sp. S16]|nr:hypothetical protein H4S04_001256 [Coemansia sp. S16]